MSIVSIAESSSIICQRKNGRNSAVINAAHYGGQNTATKASEKKPCAPVCTAERSLKLMGARRKNTARQPAISKIVSKTTRQKHKGMTAAQQRAEKNVRLCLMVVSALHALGFMTAKDTVRAAKRLIKIYEPLTGQLLISWFEQEVQNENSNEN